MGLKEIMQADLLTIERDLGNDDGPQVFTWKGEDYECHAGSTNVDEFLGIGGYNINFAKTIIVRMDLFTDTLFPKEKDRITFDGQEYRIERRITNVNKAFLKLICIDPTMEM